MSNVLKIAPQIKVVCNKIPNGNHTNNQEFLFIRVGKTLKKTLKKNLKDSHDPDDPGRSRFVEENPDRKDRKKVHNLRIPKLPSTHREKLIPTAESGNHTILTTYLLIQPLDFRGLPIRFRISTKVRVKTIPCDSLAILSSDLPKF